MNPISIEPVPDLVPLPLPLPVPSPSPQALVYVVVRLLGGGSEILGVHASAAGAKAAAQDGCEVVVLPLEP